MAPAPNPWTCMKCRTENSIVSSHCATCGLSRWDSEGLLLQQRIFGDYPPHWDETSFTGLDVALLLGFQLLGGISFCFDPLLGMSYAVLAVPPLLLTFLYIALYRIQGSPLSLKGRLKTFCACLFIIILGYLVVLSCFMVWLYDALRNC